MSRTACLVCVLCFSMLACTRGIRADETATFLALSDIHFDVDVPADAKWYDSKTETNSALWQNAQDEAKRLAKEKGCNFILFLGDLPGHGETVEERTNNFGLVLKGLREVAQDRGIPLYFVAGNNDAIQADYGSFTDKQLDPDGRTAFYYDKGHEKEWPAINGKGNLIDSSNVSLGFYSAYATGKKVAGPSLRIIVLNTVIFKNPTYYKYTPFDGVTQQQASDRQLAWLKGQLRQAKEAGDLALLAMHMPPGIDGYGGKPLWDPELAYKGQPGQNVFLNLVGAHADQIVGLISGHTHLDGIRKLYYGQGPGGAAFAELCLSVPGVTTDHGNNPGIKVFTYAPSDKYELRDFTTYFATDPQVFWRLKKSYSFRDSYTCKSCPDDVSMLEWISKITDEDQLFDDMESVLYVKHGISRRHYKEAMSVKYVNEPKP